MSQSVNQATSTPTPARAFLSLLAFLAVCFSSAAIGGLLTSKGLGDWYESLRKPSWNPPNAVFGPVWTVLYTSMAVAAWLVWRRPGWPIARGVLGLFALQLALRVYPIRGTSRG